MDRILLDNMEFYGYHGVLQSEKETGQIFRVSLEMRLDLLPAGQSDDLTQTVNYAEVYETVKQIVEKEQFDLIETLAQAISQKILAKYPVEQIRVRVDKPHAPRPGGTLAAAVEIIREKKHEHTLGLLKFGQ